MPSRCVLPLLKNFAHLAVTDRAVQLRSRKLFTTEQTSLNHGKGCVCMERAVHTKQYFPTSSRGKKCTTSLKTYGKTEENMGNKMVSPSKEHGSTYTSGKGVILSINWLHFVQTGSHIKGGCRNTLSRCMKMEK